jgi:ubiquinone/menaquinone biosynthesis C-methylase UbiE
MDDSFPSKLHVWRGQAAVLPEYPQPVPDRAISGPVIPANLADRLFAAETLNSSPRLPPAGVEAYSLQWFLEIENQRHGRHGRWLPRLLEFSRHAGETVLGLGSGLGTDWLQYARNGASVIVCNPSSDQLALVRRNFDLRGLPGRFIPAAPGSLPVEAASIDVVCICNLLHELNDPEMVVHEVYRVLKPGGKVLAVTPARFDIAFWSDFFFPWQRWLNGSSLTPKTTIRGVSARGLRRLFGRFAEHRVYKRHLRRGETPHLWRWLPPAILERLMGRMLVLKAFKPLSAAMSVHLAA